MHSAFRVVLEKTVMAMIGANPRHYLSTQLELIQLNLDSWEGINACPRTISRGLHELNDMGIIQLISPPIRGDDGQWHGRKLIIKAAGRLYAYARNTYHAAKGFLFRTERTARSVEPTPKEKGFKNQWPLLTPKDEKPPPPRDWDSFQRGFQSFKSFLNAL